MAFVMDKGCVYRFCVATAIKMLWVGVCMLWGISMLKSNVLGV